MSFECLLRIFSGAVPTDAKRERDGFKTQDISDISQILEAIQQSCPERRSCENCGPREAMAGCQQALRQAFARNWKIWTGTDVATRGAVACLKHMKSGDSSYISNCISFSFGGRQGHIPDISVV